MPRSRFVALSCLLLLASLLSATPAQAATITVTKTADTNDGACNADCSLREALIRANTVAGADTIRLPAGTYVLTRLGKDDAAASGDLDVTSEVTMRPISGTVQVDGNGIDRVIDVRSTGKLTVSRMRIVGGQPSGSVDGGGIRNAGTLDLIDSIVRGNAEVREWGGGLVNTGTAKVTRSLISGNHGKYAGGVANFGILTVVDSRLTGNVSGDSGGGIYNGSQITIIRSEVTGNWAEHGGGIYSTGQLTVERSRISRNMSSETGAGVRTGGPGVIRETVIEANRAGSDGGGLHVSGSDTFTVERSLLKANHAGSGGGIRNQGTLQLFDSTLARNRANDGGGLLGGGGTAYVIDVSIIENVAGVDGSIGNGGGMNRQSSGNIFLANTLVGGNVDLVSPHVPDCAGAIISGGYNLMETNGCSGYPGYDTDGTGAFSYRGLARNGGPTQTYALPAGSIAATHGPSGDTCSGTDQRGVPRTDPCSTGAYERTLCDGVLVNVVGTPERDSLRGTSRADGVLSLGGNDTVRAGDGNDRVCGGDGNDRLFGEGGNDRLHGEAGDDFMHGGPGRDVCVGGSGRNTRESC